MVNPLLPIQNWTELKTELATRWQELTERDLEETQGDSRSLLELMERKLGMAMDEASKKISEMTSNYHLYNEPEDEPENTIQDKDERILALKPKEPADVDYKPKDDLTI